MNARIFCRSVSVRAAPLLTLIRSVPIKDTFSLAFFAAILFFFTSEITFPSLSSMMRSAYNSANSRSCETTRTSLSSESFFSVSKTCRPVAESSAPVGSSAMMISGSLTSARAIATRCFCPPERVFGLRFAKFSNSTARRISWIFSLSFALPCNSRASATFASTVNSSKMLYS